MAWLCRGRMIGRTLLRNGCLLRETKSSKMPRKLKMSISIENNTNFLKERSYCTAPESAAKEKKVQLASSETDVAPESTKDYQNIKWFNRACKLSLQFNHPGYTRRNSFHILLSKSLDGTHNPDLLTDDECFILTGILRCLVLNYSKANYKELADMLFDVFLKRNVTTRDCMVHLLQYYNEENITFSLPKLIQFLQKNKLSLNKDLFICMIHNSCLEGDLSTARALLKRAGQSNLNLTKETRASFVMAHLRKGDFAAALEEFEAGKADSFALEDLYGQMILGYLLNENAFKAKEIHHEIGMHLKPRHYITMLSELIEKDMEIDEVLTMMSQHGTAIDLFRKIKLVSLCCKKEQMTKALKLAQVPSYQSNLRGINYLRVILEESLRLSSKDVHWEKTKEIYQVFDISDEDSKEAEIKGMTEKFSSYLTQRLKTTTSLQLQNISVLGVYGCKLFGELWYQLNAIKDMEEGKANNLGVLWLKSAIFWCLFKPDSVRLECLRNLLEVSKKKKQLSDQITPVLARSFLWMGLPMDVMKLRDSFFDKEDLRRIHESTLSQLCREHGNVDRVSAYLSQLKSQEVESLKNRAYSFYLYNKNVNDAVALLLCTPNLSSYHAKWLLREIIKRIEPQEAIIAAKQIQEAYVKGKRFPEGKQFLYCFVIECYLEGGDDNKLLEAWTRMTKIIPTAYDYAFLLHSHFLSKNHGPIASKIYSMNEEDVSPDHAVLQMYLGLLHAEKIDEARELLKGVGKSFLTDGHLSIPYFTHCLHHNKKKDQLVEELLKSMTKKNKTMGRICYEYLREKKEEQCLKLLKETYSPSLQLILLVIELFSKKGRPIPDELKDMKAEAEKRGRGIERQEGSLDLPDK